MNDFQEQAKNWLRNVVKQNPDKIKAGVEKAGDLVDKQTGGKYAEKVDAVQQKVGTFVDSHNTEDAPADAASGSAPESAAGTAGAPPADQPESKPDDATSDGAQEATDQAGSAGAGNVASPGGGDPGVVGGEVPDPASHPDRSAGSQTGGAQTGGTATGQTGTN